LPGGAEQLVLRCIAERELDLGYGRTSVDHGTGYDIAWRGVADPSGLHSAMKLALRLLVERVATTVTRFRTGATRGAPLRK
jgi:hypothetical protein